MPFRRLYAATGARHPAAYSLLTLAAGAVAAMLVSILISVRMAQAADERGRRASCALINAQVEVFAETPPATPAGANAAAAWRDLATRFECWRG